MRRSHTALVLLCALLSTPAEARTEEDIEEEAKSLFPIPSDAGKEETEGEKKPDGPTFTRLVEMYYPNDEAFQTFSTYGPEPGGAACLAYVHANSPNHKLLKKMMKAADTAEGDEMLYWLQMRIAVAVDWQPKVNESITLFYRNPFEKYFQWEQLGPFQPENHTFPTKPGVPWKEKQLRSWILKHGYPLVNMRSLDRKDGEFPQAKYIGSANKAGLVLVAMNMSGQREFVEQYKLLKWLKPHAEKYRGKLRFALLERTSKTRTARAYLGVGLDLKIQNDMILVENFDKPTDPHDLNHWHGLPKKYRLQDPTQESINDFFEKYAKGQLIPFWKSQENWTYTGGKAPKGHATHLTGLNFESVVYDEDPQKARLVAFFNMDPKHNCENCLRDFGTWEQIAKRVAMTGALRAKVIIAAIDQSSNEHSEVKIAGKLAQPALMWYPPGSRSSRFKKRRRMDALATVWGEEDIIKGIEDEIEKMDDEEEDQEDRPKKRRRKLKKAEL